ncbi:DUF748 domain-containing protein [Ottowia testudinis]|uniref:DUF748 domain-containing protein n=1 Tax=Ottowia testudinis TaxID=2816950 RepID=A0A975CCL1_9BURK|nr:DUF748 domain-containing protein [Ottowia testudinis]QTD43910.1 DUF748 domain-containing protein [Ottowia testudinis]
MYDDSQSPSSAPAAGAAAASAVKHPDAASPARRRWLPANRWARRALYGVAGLLGLWALGWLAVPPLLKWQGEKIASEQLGRAVRIGAVDFKPWTLELTLSDVAVGGAAGAPDQFSVKRVYADAALQSLFRLAPVVDAIQVEAPALRLTHLGGGHYDVDDILAKLAARPQPAETGEPARFAIYNIDLAGGRIDFDDRTVNRQHEVRDLRLTLPFVSNLPSERKIKVQPQLAFVANGSAFDSRAETLPFAASRQTDAVLRLSGLDLKPYLVYLPASLPIKLQAAVVDADLRLDFEQTPKPSLRLGGTLAVNGLKSVDGQGADALAFDALKLQLSEVRPLERKVHLAAVELNSPQLALRRLPDGQFNLLVVPGAASATKSEAARAGQASAGGVLDAASAPRAQASAPSTAAPAWQLVIDKLAVHGGALDFTDDTTAVDGAPAAVVRLKELELAAATIGLPFAQPLSFNGSAALVGIEGLTPPIPGSAPPRAAAARKARHAGMAPAAAPQAAASGAVAAAPSIEFQGTAAARGAEVNARVAGLPLALAAPYLAPHLVPHLTGDLDAHVGLQWAPPQAQGLPPELKVAAERLTLRQLMLADAPAGRGTPTRTARTSKGGGPLASIGQIDVAELLVDLRGRAVTVGKLAVQTPRVVVERGADQALMYQAWLRQPPAATPKPKASGGPAADFPWKLLVKELALAGGTVGWRDAAVPGTVEAELSQLQIDAKQVDPNSKTPIPVNLSARLSSGRTEPGRLSWRGSVGLTPLTAQGAVDAERLPVHAFEPYFGDALNVDILRADTSFKGNVAFAQLTAGPRLRVSGDASVQELRTHSRPGSAVASDGPRAAAPAAVASATRGGVTTAEAAAASQAALAPSARPSVRGGGLGEELLSWKLLKLGGIDVQLEPGKAPQVEVKDTLLSDFYARLVIHPDGRINLQDVVKSKDGAPAAASAASAPAPAAPPGTPAAGENNGEAINSVASGASQASAGAPKASPDDPLAPVVRFGPIRMASGRVLFSDRFIRPNYSADLTELNGALSAFSSAAPAGAPQMADLNLTGRAEGTAALQVDGKLNPLAKPLALDIKAKVTDLELPPLSPYAVKYAGHGIERGKLSMDVAYVVQPDGRLTASNKLVLNQLEFGEPVPGAPASLPVKLATALLADSQGVIDLDLPISGSLNDPQFSVGPIIVKAIVNLIGRAITAPFTLLARALGGGAGGDDMANVAFAPGSASLSPKAREQLDQVAKALLDRPQLKLTVVGTASLAAERDGYKRERLKSMVAAEQRAAAPAAAASAPLPAASQVASEKIAAAANPSSASGRTDAASAAASASVADADYPRLLRQLYRRADLPGKPRNAIGMTRDLPVPEMEALLLAHIDVGDDAMRQLALQRGVAVKDYLAAKKLPPERLFLGAPRASATVPANATSPAGAASAPAAASPWSPRAELALTMR